MQIYTQVCYGLSIVLCIHLLYIHLYINHVYHIYTEENHFIQMLAYHYSLWCSNSGAGVMFSTQMNDGTNCSATVWYQTVFSFSRNPSDPDSCLRELSLTEVLRKWVTLYFRAAKGWPHGYLMTCLCVGVHTNRKMAPQQSDNRTTSGQGTLLVTRPDNYLPISQHFNGEFKIERQTQ